MGAFKRVNIELVPEIIVKLDNDKPYSTVQCQMLEMYRQCKKISPTLDARLYTPDGIVDEFGTFFLYVPDHRGNMLFHTTDTDHEKFKRRILDIGDVDWANSLVLGPIDERFHKMVLEIMKEKNLRCVEDLPFSDNLDMPIQTGLNLKIEVPDGMELKPIRLDQAKFVDDNWPHQGPKTLPLIEDTIKLNGGFALYFKNESVPVSWGLHSIVGGVGMIQTHKAHRGKRYGDIIGKALTKMIAEKGMEPQLQINHGLSASKRLFTRMGYKVTHNIMAGFERANLDLVPKILQILKHDVPASTVPCQMLQSYINCKNVVPDLDLRLYTPGGKLDEYGTFFLYVPEHRGNLVFHTTDTDLNLLKRRILGISDINWSGVLVLGGVDDRFNEMVKEIMVEKSLRYCEAPNPSHNFAIPIETALNLEINIPDGIELRPVGIEDTEFINDRWPHKGPKTYKYLQDTIRLNGGYALHIKDTNERVAWCLHSLVGGVGMIQTAEEHRGKGYAEIVGKTVTKMIAEKGIEPQAQITQGLEPSRRLFSKIGFRSTHVLHWYCFTNGP